MKKQERKNFKMNSYKRTWWWAQRDWVQELLNFPLIYALQKHKWGERWYRRYLKLRFFITRKPVMPMGEYMVTTMCTLRCKWCNSFMSKFKDENQAKPATFEEFKQDLDKLLKSVDFINFFGFVGGEPMISKDIGKMIEYACKQKQLKQVFIATNATILPSQETLNAMKHKKFAVHLSDYSHVKNIKNGVTVKYDEFKKLMIENNIRFNNYQEKREASTWFTPPTVYKDVQDSEYLTNYYQKECNQICNLICDGVLVPCTVAPYVYKNLELTDEIKRRAINLREPKSQKQLTKEMIEYFAEPFSPFCHYCHHPEVQHMLPCGEQVED